LYHVYLNNVLALLCTVDIPTQQIPKGYVRNSLFVVIDSTFSDPHWHRVPSIRKSFAGWHDRLAAPPDEETLSFSV